MNNLERLAKGQYGKLLIATLEDVKNQVADIRTNLDMTPETRIATIKVIDKLLIEKLKIVAGELAPPDPNENI